MARALSSSFCKLSCSVVTSWLRQGWRDLRPSARRRRFPLGEQDDLRSETWPERRVPAFRTSSSHRAGTNYFQEGGMFSTSPGTSLRTQRVGSGRHVAIDERPGDVVRDRLRVNFVLPAASPAPVGGYKVEYQYADGLVREGHRATVLHAWTEQPKLPKGGLLRLASKAALMKARRIPLVPWHEFRQGTRTKLIPSLYRTTGFPSADVTVLTGWNTAAHLPSADRLGRLVQVVYDYEIWRSADDRLRIKMAQAFRRPDVVRFATSSAVRAMLEEVQTDWQRTLNPGIDLRTFRRVRDPRDRERFVSFPLRKGGSKGIDVLLAALAHVRRRLPDLRVVCFGAATVDLPNWIECRGVVPTAELVEIYNASSVFVLPSLYEGWGLPALEAMACGAAVTTTRNGGVEDFCVDNVNCRLADPGDVDGLAQAIVSLLLSDEERTRLAIAGEETSQGYSLESATALFVRAIEDVARRARHSDERQ